MLAAAGSSQHRNSRARDRSPPAERNNAAAPSRASAALFADVEFRTGEDDVAEIDDADLAADHVEKRSPIGAIEGVAVHAFEAVVVAEAVAAEDFELVDE